MFLGKPPLSSFESRFDSEGKWGYKCDTLTLYSLSLNEFSHIAGPQVSYVLGAWSTLFGPT